MFDLAVSGSMTALTITRCDSKFLVEHIEDVESLIPDGVLKYMAAPVQPAVSQSSAYVTYF